MSYKAEINYVTCVYCGKRYQGKIPKGGDGSVLFPRKHKVFLHNPVSVGGGISVDKGKFVTCPGSYQEAKEYKDLYFNPYKETEW